MARRTDDIGFGGLRLIQDTDYFCYGVDAVLLADFAADSPHRHLVDIGTNNGIIPLITAGITETPRITGIEVQEGPARLAEENVSLNDLGERIRIIRSDILDIDGHLEKGCCDAVTCNPPYTEKGRGIINEGDSLTAARHETTAGLEDFIKGAAWLLADRGAFYMIHRPARIIDIACSCRKYRLEPKLLRFISPRRGEKPNLMLIKCIKNAGRELKLLEPLAVYSPDGGYTEEILKIYRKI